MRSLQGLASFALVFWGRGSAALELRHTQLEGAGHKTNKLGSKCWYHCWCPQVAMCLSWGLGEGNGTCQLLCLWIVFQQILRFSFLYAPRIFQTIPSMLYLPRLFVVLSLYVQGHSFLFFKDFIYLFMKDTERDRGRGRNRLAEGSPMWDSIPRPWDHALS